MISDSLYDLAKDPTKNYGVPKIKDAVPYLNFSDLENANDILKEPR